MNNKVVITLLATVGVIASTSAKTIRLDIRPAQKDITQTLTTAAGQMTRTDTLVVTFAKGNFIIAKAISFPGHVVMKGAGEKKSIITLLDHQDFKSDVFLKIDGRKNAPVSLSMSKLAINLGKHDGILWNTRSEKFLIKVNHGNRINIDHFASYCDNAFCTNLDFRVCENITITNSSFTNYNNCSTGGILWFRGNIQNVVVRNNRLYKYGNDEAIAFWEVGDDAHARKPLNTTSYKRNITVADKYFFFGRPEKERYEDVGMDVMVTLFADEYGNYNIPTHFQNISFSNNEFDVDAPVKCIMGITIDKNTTHQGVSIVGNEINNLEGCSEEGSSHTDFQINDFSATPSAILIKGNKTQSQCEVFDKYGHNGYTHLGVDGALVQFEENTVVSYASTAKRGVRLIWVKTKGGSILLNSNVCKGLEMLCQASFGNGVPQLTLNAQNNYFQGDTRIHCSKLDKADISFTNNTINSTRYEYFLQEFAKSGSLVFNYNKVTAGASGCPLMAHYNQDALETMEFTKLEVMGNEFKGVGSEKILLKNFINVKNRKVRGNAFVR